MKHNEPYEPPRTSGFRYLSVCSGMEAATVAWHKLGWEAAGFSEVDPFPSEILKIRFPNTKNYGDLTQYKSWPFKPGSIDLLVGGTPCQSFSVAGLRRGLEDPRGNLALVFLGLADKTLPRWIVWENVPGILSSNDGKDFGSFLGALGELGYGYAYRVLDAQNFGVPQRRRRVFVVAYLGDWRPAAEVLFECESLRGYLEAGDKAEQVPAGKTDGGPEGRDCFGRNNTSGPIDTAGCLTAHKSQRLDFATDTFVTEVKAFRKSRRAQSVDDHETWVDDGVANTLNLFENTDIRTTHAIISPTVTTCKGSRGGCSDEAIAEIKAVHNAREANQIIPIQDGREIEKRQNGLGVGQAGDPSYTVDTTGAQSAMQNTAVRRLTPVECERLQGFPDNWSRIPWRGRPEEECPDGLRYRVCGNSMAVPVMSWIGRRINAWERKSKRPPQ